MGEDVTVTADEVRETGEAEARAAKPVPSAAAQWGEPAAEATDEAQMSGQSRDEGSGAESETAGDGGEGGTSGSACSGEDEREGDGESSDRPKRRRRRRRRRGSGEGSPEAEDDRPGSKGAPPESADADDANEETLDRARRRQRRVEKPKLEVGSDDWKEVFSGDTFRSLGLRDSVCKGVDELGFEYTTHIQAKLIPEIVSGRDVLGQARTGTGKTAAFGMPIFHMSKRQTPFQCVVLAPTRELAIQIGAELEAIGKWTPIRVATVYGGKNMERQIRELKSGPDVIVATPGRLIDVVERRAMHLRNVRQVVLDEVDRMLDIGFREDIRRILSMVKSTDHQTIFVSATISAEIEKLAKTFMTDPVDVRTVTGSLTVSLVDQFYTSVQPWDKRPMLIHLIRKEDPDVAVVFCQMKRTVDKIQGRLRDAGIDAEAIHGDMMQSRRNAIIRKLRAGELHILVATDLAARGLDVDGITHVVNFDLPEDPEVYIHRIGRTARAGRRGRAFTLVTPEQGSMLTAIEVEANTHISAMTFDDFEPGPEPEDVVAEKKAAVEQAEHAEKLNRYAKPDVPAAEAVDASKFPGGIIPSKLPPKLMKGRVRTSKTARLEAHQAKMRE